MKLVVGLGNPGRKYDGTRHNIGFVVLAELAARHAAPRPKSAFQAEVTEIVLGAERVLLAWPQTFMNVSGSSVLAVRDFYKLGLSDLLVVCDDFHLPLAKLRFRPSGSAGGQKGLDDILRRLGSNQVQRLRFGVGELPPGYDAAGYVLGKFSREELGELQPAVDKAVQAVGDWIQRGIEFCMNQYNGGSGSKSEPGQ